jgi:ABC-type multidrug transport system fused ATPase/permease subunit
MTSGFEKKKDQKYLGWWELCTKYASAGDKCILFSAIFGTAIMSASGPLFAVAWGGATDDIVDADSQKEMPLDYSAGILFSLVGTVTGVGMFFKYTLFSIFAENIAHKLKLKYFRAALEKDSAYYDLQN